MKNTVFCDITSCSLVESLLSKSNVVVVVVVVVVLGL
jgi:hypothetical protein